MNNYQIEIEKKYSRTLSFGLNANVFLLKKTHLRPFVSGGVAAHCVKWPGYSYVKDSSERKNIGGDNGMKIVARAGVGAEYRISYSSYIQAAGWYDTYKTLFAQLSYIYKF